MMALSSALWNSFCDTEYRHLASIAKLRLEERPWSSNVRRAVGGIFYTKKSVLTFIRIPA